MARSSGSKSSSTKSSIVKTGICTYKVMSEEITLKKCPLCGSEASYTELPHARVFNIGCGKDDFESTDPDCTGCGLVLYGNSDVSLAEMAARWNNSADRE